jgi:hypothetical protein
MYISKFKLIVAVGVTAIGFSVLGAGLADAAQTHMLNARDDLWQARNQLQLAIPDKDGHRVDAINLISQAIDQVNLGIQAGAE